MQNIEKQSEVGVMLVGVRLGALDGTVDGEDKG